VVYTEKQVNAIIARFHEDVAGLRRDLIDRGMLARERDGSRYWRPDGIQPAVNGGSDVDGEGDKK
jgi:hypothetical protein